MLDATNEKNVIEFLRARIFVESQSSDVCIRVLAYRHWQEYEFIPIETLATSKLSAFILPQQTFIAAFFPHVRSSLFNRN